jgi:hypothetical protein
MPTQQIETSSSTAWKICRDGLPLFPYKMKLSQPLSEDGTARRCALGGSGERYWRTIRVSWMSHGPPMKHISAWMVTLTSKMSDSGPMESPRLTIQRETQQAVYYRA